jgi:hypothetical protein
MRLLGEIRGATNDIVAAWENLHNGVALLVGLDHNAVTDNNRIGGADALEA